MKVNQSAICAWFGITRQAHHQMRQRQAQRAAEAEQVVEAVQGIRQKHPRMGGRKLLVKLRPFLTERSIALGRDRFLTLLRERGLLVPQKRKGRRTTFPGGVRSQDLLSEADITRANQAWVADITYLELEIDFVYLALVTDRYSRKILGWDLSTSLSLEGARRALEQAIRQASGPLEGLIHHSDHGVQYTSRPYLEVLHDQGIRPSMGRVGNCYDNAVAERVNGILKLEYLLDQRFPSFLAARAAVQEAIQLYNNDRPHLSLDYATPAEVHRRSLAA